jgi:hypothetical protein
VVERIRTAVAAQEFALTTTRCTEFVVVLENQISHCEVVHQIISRVEGGRRKEAMSFGRDQKRRIVAGNQGITKRRSEGGRAWNGTAGATANQSWRAEKLEKRAAGEKTLFAAYLCA